MEHTSRLKALIASDAARWQLLQHVHSLQLADCWVAAGFVRNAVWDHLHGRTYSPLASDVDVIWFNPKQCEAEQDRDLEAKLLKLEPGVMWSVKNQARMHHKNGDDAYLSATDAMRYWPETATAVAVRIGANGECEVAAPLGLQDLFQLVLRPTARFVVAKQAIYQQRLKTKDWLSTWPLLRAAAGEA